MKQLCEKIQDLIQTRLNWINLFFTTEEKPFSNIDRVLLLCGNFPWGHDNTGWVCWNASTFKRFPDNWYAINVSWFTSGCMLSLFGISRVSSVTGIIRGWTTRRFIKLFQQFWVGHNGATSIDSPLSLLSFSNARATKLKGGYIYKNVLDQSTEKKHWYALPLVLFAKTHSCQAVYSVLRQHINIRNTPFFCKSPKNLVI